MAGMGRHNALLNGSRGEDGAIAAAPVIQAIDMSRLLSRPRGPMEDIPQPRPGADVHPEPPARACLDGDRLRRGSMWLLASGVAAIAAIVSYSHIYDLGRAHGGTGVPARLLPLSVDMLILVGELMLLHEADGKGRRFILGWVLIWSGILATLAANVTYGYQFGLVGAIIWGWPAYSFILAAGGMVAVVKRGASRTSEVAAEGIEPPSPAPDAMDIAQDIQADAARDIELPARVDKPQARTGTSRRRATGAAKAADILKRNPGLSNAEVAKRAGVSEKTVSRARNAKAAPKRQERQES